MYTQTTFTFGGAAVTSVVPDIMIPDIRRPLRPEYRKHKVEIPGRDGSWDFGVSERQDFNIEVDFNILSTTSSALMVSLRELDTFLTGKKELIFSDDTSVSYMARVYAMIALNKRVFSYAQSGTIVFECDSYDATLTGLEITGVVAGWSPSPLYVPGALVRLYSGHDADPNLVYPIKQTYTTETGTFDLGLAPAGSYSVNLSKTGYTTTQQNVTITDSPVYVQFIFYLL